MEIKLSKLNNNYEVNKIENKMFEVSEVILDARL
jgi:hypothetical protein